MSNWDNDTNVIRDAMCLILYVKALVVTFNLENAFTMIVKTDG